MPKKRINIEIKPCCSNCKDHGQLDCLALVDQRNPCAYWTASYGWFSDKLNAAEKKLDNAKKAAKKPKPRQDDDEDE